MKNQKKKSYSATIIKLLVTAKIAIRQIALDFYQLQPILG